MRILINHVEPGSFILGLRRLAGYCDFFFFACQVVKISDKSAHPPTHPNFQKRWYVTESSILLAVNSHRSL